MTICLLNIAPVTSIASSKNNPSEILIAVSLPDSVGLGSTGSEPWLLTFWRLQLLWAHASICCFNDLKASVPDHGSHRIAAIAAVALTFTMPSIPNTWQTHPVTGAPSCWDIADWVGSSGASCIDTGNPFCSQPVWNIEHVSLFDKHVPLKLTQPLCDHLGWQSLTSVLTHSAC